MKTPPPRDCELCRIEYQPNHKGSRFCSRSCATKQKNLNRWGSAPRVCPTCGDTLVRKGDHAFPTYCSRRCSGIAIAEARFPTARADKEARKAERAVLTASRRATKLIHDAFVLRKKHKSCPVCGSDFTVAPTRGRPMDTCSGECRDAWRVIRLKEYLAAHPEKRKDSPEYRRVYRKKRRALGLDDKGKNRKRARRFGVAYERVVRRRVYERDGWQCQLCHKAINRTAVVPHPLAATLDHIVPMSRGGAHTYANVHAAHFTCNTAKGVKSMGEQLLLVG